MPEALAAVKRELGPDAVILGTRYLPTSGLQAMARRRRVEVTAAPGHPQSPAPRLRSHRALPPPEPQPAAPRSTPAPAPAPSNTADILPKDLYRHYVHLVQNEVAAEVAERLVRSAADAPTGRGHGTAATRAALRNYIAEMVPDPPGITIPPGATRRVALVGPPGSGKSTTIAKLAALFRLRQNKRVALLSLDMHRLAAHEQLHRYAEALDVPLYTAQTITDVRKTVKGLSGVDVLLIDTPGVGLREQARFARVASLLRATRPDEIHLVLPASLIPEVQTRIAQGFSPLGIARVVLTRLDEVVGFGVVLNVVARLNLGVSYLTTGQNVPNDIEEACGPRLAELLCAMDDSTAGGAVIR